MALRTKNILAVATAKDKTFEELVEISGLSPSLGLSGLNLERVNFQGSNLWGFNFTGARLHSAQFSGAWIEGAVFDAPQRGLPELQAAEDYDDAADAWREQTEKRKRPISVSGEWRSIWEDGNVPVWVDEFGTDSYGKWASFTVNDVTQVLRFCPPGRFLMGSPETEPYRDKNEGQQQKITFEHGFWLADTTVSQNLYESVLGTNPSAFQSLGNPVEMVGREEATDFINRLNECVPELCSRLPFDFEWEYTCRAGSETQFNPAVGRTHGGLSTTPDEVNYDGNRPYGDAEEGESRQKTVSVKGSGFRPNNWGVWHMHGNVWELSANNWSESHEDTITSSKTRRVPEQESVEWNHVLCGGSWYDGALRCRSASRLMLLLDSPLGNKGFRLAVG